MLKYIAAETDRFTALLEHAIMLRMIDRGNLKTHGVTAHIYRCKMFCHWITEISYQSSNADRCTITILLIYH